jgi:serine/threonine protein kinase
LSNLYFQTFFQDECNGYGFEVDAWACGVIMYTLLIGRPPFWNRKQMMLIRQIMKGEYTMVGPDWDEVTSETKDLVRASTDKLQPGNTKGGKYHSTVDLLFHQFGLVCFANKNKNCQ